MYPLLQGLSVIEASSFIASPSAGLYCAQFGADVIRVDPIGGGPDFDRWPVTRNNDSLYWENLNRAKRSVALNLKSDKGRALLVALIRATGQLLINSPVEGYLSHSRLAEGCADLVTVRVMGRADGGPALDYTVNNMVGYPMLTGEGSEPVNHVLPAWDLLTGAYAAFALLAAIRRREMTGEGGEVRVPLADVAIGTVANLGGIAEMLYEGRDRPRQGNRVYGLFGRDFVTADGVRMMIVAESEAKWTRLTAVLGLGGAYSERDALYPVFETAIRGWTHAALAEALDRAGIVHSRYQTMLEAAHDPVLVRDNPIFADGIANPSGFDYPAAGSFGTVPQLERAPPRPAPLNGQHSEEVLSERLNLSSGEIARLIDAGIVGTATETKE